MSVKELLLRVLWNLRPMLPALAAAAALTLLAMPILMVLCRRAWVCDRGFRISGLFFGLTGKGIFCLSCAWLKLIFLLTFLVEFEKLTLLGYGMILFPGLMMALCAGTFLRKLSGIFWLFLQTAGLLSVNLICGYIRDMKSGPGLFLVYVAMGLFLALFSIYLFLLEVRTISDGRHVAAKQIWVETDE